MKWGILATLLLTSVLFAPLHTDRPAAGDNASLAQARFEAVDIYVDSGAAFLAAYQVEFKSSTGGVKIVGVEGGETPAFKAAPFYDPEAMQSDRVIIGAYSTLPTLPSGRTRVARIHVMLEPGAAPDYRTELQTAGAPGGSKINASASWTPAEAGAAQDGPGKTDSKGGV